MSVPGAPSCPLSDEIPPATGVTVFGLDVRANTSLALLEGTSAKPTGRTLELIVAPEQTQVSRCSAPGMLVCDQRELDGSVSFRIESYPSAGYQISGPAYGRHLVSVDGRRMLCMPGPRDSDVWQRLLIAQLLPFAALLQGLEVLHASAVVIDDAVIALAGPSRAGKTSVALELCRRGAGFFADDVLALQRRSAMLLGHPGSPIAGLDHHEARRIARESPGERRETVAANAREQLVRMQGAAGPLPLRALFFLDRRGDAPGLPRFESAADPQLLLGSSFNSVITSPVRLRGLLEICALAAHGRVERVCAGAGVDATQVAAAIEHRLQRDS